MAFTGANGASATISSISYDSSTVKVEVTPDDALVRHVLDFIELDGTVSLSLDVFDATVDAANDTLSWAVSSAPWEDGDKLMVRIRKAPLRPPPAPTGMRLDEGVTFNRMRWDAADGVSHWRLERRGGGRSEWRVQGNVRNFPGSALSKTSTVDYYRVRAYGDGVTYAEEWSEPSNLVTALPDEYFAFTFKPNPLALGGRSDVWTVPDGVTQVFLAVDSTGNGARGAGDIWVNTLGANDRVISTLAIGGTGWKGVLGGVVAGTRLRIDVDADAFDDRAPVVTLQFHIGFNIHLRVLAAAAIQKEARPHAPTGGSAEVDAATRGVTLHWNAGASRAGAKPDHYEVLIPNPADTDTPLYENRNVGDSSDPVSLTIADALTALGQGTHTAQVYHCNVVGGCSLPLEIEFTLVDSPPAPSSLSVGVVTDTTVALAWDAVDGASRYRVERRIGADGEWTVASESVTGTSHTVEGLSPNTANEFRVSAYGDGTAYPATFGDPSDAVSARTLFAFSPSPLGLGGMSDVWTVPDGVTGVYVKVAVSGGGVGGPGGAVEDPGAGAIRVNRIDAGGAELSTLSVRGGGDSGVLSGAIGGSLVRVDVDADAFDADASLVTLSFHSGTDGSGPELARATVQRESRPSAPVNGSAVVDRAVGSVTLAWSRGTSRVGSSPDHYEVVIPDSADAASPCTRT